MSPKIYTQEFKEAVVKFYERNHTIEETIQEFGISQTSLFDWRKLYSKEHDLIINGSSKYKNFRQSQAHLKKTNETRGRFSDETRGRFSRLLETLSRKPCLLNLVHYPKVTFHL